MDFKMHEYTHALVGKVTPGADYGEGVEFEGVRRQHDIYTRLLKEAHLEVIEVDLEGCPQTKLFIDNMAVVCHGIALLPRNGSTVEKNNTKILKEILQKDLGHTVIDEMDPEAKISCTDVFCTGREIFVGISENTNEAGANVVAEAFPEFPCTSVRVPRGEKGLKDYITMAGPDLLCVSNSKEDRKVLKRIEREAAFTRYRTLTVSEEEAANCIYVNGTLIHRAIEEVPHSFRVFCEKIDFPRRSICFNEIGKIPGGLSTCSLLVRKF